MKTEDLIEDHLERLKDPALKQDKFDEIIGRIKTLRALAQDQGKKRK